MPGTCLSFSREDSTQFVVGSENGGLFKCFLPSLDSTRVDEHTGEGVWVGGCEHMLEHAGGIKCAAYIMSSSLNRCCRHVYNYCPKGCTVGLVISRS